MKDGKRRKDVLVVAVMAVEGQGLGTSEFGL